jgi:hypothetical protein
MPFTYQRDDTRRIIRLTATEPVSLLDVTTMLDRQLADDAWQYGMLVDSRRAILSPAEGRALLEHVRQLAVQHGPHGPVALVTREGGGGAQAYAVRSAQVALPVDVFWDVDEAERWLGGQLQRQTS